MSLLLPNRAGLLFRAEKVTNGEKQNKKKAVYAALVQHLNVFLFWGLRS